MKSRMCRPTDVFINKSTYGHWYVSINTIGTIYVKFDIFSQNPLFNNNPKCILWFCTLNTD